MATTPTGRTLPSATHASDDVSPIHPGEVLLEEFLRPLRMSVYEAAKRMRVPNTRIHQLVHQRRSVTADTAIRLGYVFGTTPEFWMNLQNQYDLRTTQVEVELLQPIPLREGGKDIAP